MKILIATALFPPDIADPAPYVKELATRLQANHMVTVLTYGRFPESVSGVTVEYIPKQTAALWRMFLFTRALWRLTQKADCVLIQNAPSTELPAAIVGLFYKKKLLIMASDTKIKYSGWRKLVSLVANMSSHKRLTINLPTSRPEIHPFRELSDTAHTDHETSWKKHLTTLETYLV